MARAVQPYKSPTPTNVSLLRSTAVAAQPISIAQSVRALAPAQRWQWRNHRRNRETPRSEDGSTGAPARDVANRLDWPNPCWPEQAVAWLDDGDALDDDEILVLLL